MPPAPAEGSAGKGRGSGVRFRFLVPCAGVIGELVPGKVCTLPAIDMFMFSGFGFLSDCGDGYDGKGGTAGVCCRDAVR